MSITTCDDVIRAISAHHAGDEITIDVLRDSGGGDPPEHVAAHVTLTTRSEVLARRVGQHLDAELDDDEGRHWALADRRRHALVLGVFDANCAGCTGLVDRVTERLARRAPDAEALAVVADPAKPLTPARVHGLRGTAPIAVADAATFDALAAGDADRAFFLVIDGRGVVRLLAPIAPGADDVPAAIDEVLAAAEQAEHARTRR